MFALTEEDLRRRILDCPGGASSFTTEVTAAGGDITACDPIYATATPAELALVALTEVERGNAYVRAHPGGFVWTFFADPAAHRTTRRAAAGIFAAHQATGSNHYVPAALPELPFEDRRFDLVLSSHLLFSYSDRLDLDFHHRAIAELVRVARSEVRLYPLLAVGAASPIRAWSSCCATCTVTGYAPVPPRSAMSSSAAPGTCWYAPADDPQPE